MANDRTIDLIDSLVAGGRGMPEDEATKLVLRAFQERAQSMGGRFPPDLALRAGDKWIDGWLTAAEFFDPMNKELYGTNGVPI